jgi:hypothetical protein
MVYGLTSKINVQQNIKINEEYIYAERNNNMMKKPSR